ncbi:MULTISPECIES: hypothetical protein [unclassified Exiguobacterium]|uniref:hypothetical protein n=1 Tax=unclassified Exiguobacterium TaxID=2644629 RepID=UPI00093CBED5|nr:MULTISPECIES: hypothetical protein [unclassified Exiguobacterium]
MKRKSMISMGLAVGLLALGGAAQAGTTYSNYDTTVASFNGSGYTGYQTKSSSNASGTLSSKTVGGSYTVDARMTASSGTGSWVRSVSDNETRSLSNSISSGRSTRVQFSNDLTTPVSVQVTGQWKSN